MGGTGGWSSHPGRRNSRYSSLDRGRNVQETKQAGKARAPRAEGQVAEYVAGSSPSFLTCPLPAGLSPVSWPPGWEACVLTPVLPLKPG